MNTLLEKISFFLEQKIVVLLSSPHQKLILLRTLSYFFILGGIFWIGYSLFPVFSAEAVYMFNQSNTEKITAINEYQRTESFGKILEIIPPPPPLPVEPINYESAIIIPKIDVNAPIVMNVSVANEAEYNSALKSGVAHAAGTNTPAEKIGNFYLFAHSTLNPAEIQRYSAVFTLLHRLEAGDRISVMYKNTRYDYQVSTNEVVNSFNLEPLTRQPTEPIITLQTCDPPGIPLNRRIITAQLIASYPNQH